MTGSHAKVNPLPASGEMLRRRATKLARETEGQQRHLRRDRAVTLAIARLHPVLAQKFPGEAYADMATSDATEARALSEALVFLNGERRRV